MLQRLSIAGAATAMALAAGGCGGGDGDGDRGGAAKAPVSSSKTATESTPTAAAARRRGTRVKIIRSEFGRVLADRRGEALYLFDKEKTKRSECYGACARAWPPVLTKGKPRAGKGARARLLGTTRRRNGKRQVTYRGHPLYYYVHDEPGRILCQDVEEFGGTWLLVRRSGRAVR
jgi:predicted lipoprotein with Yx(FWY)xxD motif